MWKCQICTLDVVKYEKHFLLKQYGELRSILFEDLASDYGYFTHLTTDDKFKGIMTLKNV